MLFAGSHDGILTPLERSLMETVEGIHSSTPSFVAVLEVSCAQSLLGREEAHFVRRRCRWNLMRTVANWILWE